MISRSSWRPAGSPESTARHRKTRGTPPSQPPKRDARVPGREAVWLPTWEGHRVQRCAGGNPPPHALSSWGWEKLAGRSLPGLALILPVSTWTWSWSFWTTNGTWRQCHRVKSTGPWGVSGHDRRQPLCLTWKRLDLASACLESSLCYTALLEMPPYPHQHQRCQNVNFISKEQFSTIYHQALERSHANRVSF